MKRLIVSKRGAGALLAAAVAEFLFSEQQPWRRWRFHHRLRFRVLR